MRDEGFWRRMDLRAGHIVIALRFERKYKLKKNDIEHWTVKRIHDLLTENFREYV